MNARRAGVALALFGAFVACGGSVAVGRTDASGEQLQTTANGQPTGNGTTCTWAGTALLAANPNADVPATYAVGAAFGSIDGCNLCTCAAQGIMCTVRTCTVTACPADAMVCPDGTTVSRTGADCSFPACPVVPDASVSPVGADAGAADCNALTASAKNDITAAVASEESCTVDDDCTGIADATSCSAGCSAVIAKTSQSDFNAAKAKVEANQCAQFKAANCQFAASACPAIMIEPKCTNNKCTGAVDP